MTAPPETSADQRPSVPESVEPAPPRRRRGLVVVLLCAGLVVLVGVAVLAYRAAPGPWSSPGPAGIRSGTDHLHDGDLRAFLLPPPPLALPWPAPPSPDERMTAAQHAARFQDPAGRQRFLARYRFQLGAVRAWVYPDGVQVRIELLQFEVGELARGFVVAQEQDLASRYPPDSVRVVPQVTTGRAYTSTGNGLGLTRVVFRRGDVVAELAYGNPGTPDPDEAVRQALGQFERL